MQRVACLSVSLIFAFACGATAGDDAGGASDGRSGSSTAAGGLDSGGEGGAAGPSAGGGESESASGVAGVDAGGAEASDGGHSAAAGAAEQGGAGGADEPGRCPAVPSCDAAPPNVGVARAWRHQAPFGAPNHRGRDLFVNPGAAQWVIGNFQYGLAVLEAPLQDEEVDVYLLRDCGEAWEKLGSARTTQTPTHAPVEGVSDAMGRFYFEIPQAKRLGLGRHRLRLVVAGDLSATELFIEVVEPSTPVFVSDMDGTLTTSENAQALALLTGSIPDANPESSEVLRLLVLKGYRPLYLTARPEWLVERSREFLTSKGFPPGIIHTTLSPFGASGAAAVSFKTEELQQLGAKGLAPAYAFGNTATDADAYNNAVIQPLDRRIFFQFTDEAWQGRRIEAYGSLLAEVAQLGLACN